MNEGYGFSPPAASAGGIPTRILSGATHIVPANYQEIAVFNVQVDGDIQFDGDWVFIQ